MYTVIRFLGTNENKNALSALGEQLNELIPGSYSSVSEEEPIRFNVSVSHSSTWTEHLSEIMEFLDRAAPVLEAARREGVVVHADIAVEPADRHGRVLPCFSLGVEHLRNLANQGVSVEFSIYPG
ncbi:MAG: hypothetical protein QGH60_20055 [Phycisphaerae bacterium]|jgi:hypothetical protein|nr:hypothetical protein [Phycisphaerae bacterium]